MTCKLHTRRGGEINFYISPVIEIWDLETEKGFATSTDRPDSGYGDNDNGDY